jgi:serine/threonine protein kinase
VEECIEKLACAGSDYLYEDLQPSIQVKASDTIRTVADADNDKDKDFDLQRRATSPEMLQFSMNQRSFRCRRVHTREIKDFEFLGNGCMGEVFSATFRGQNVAVKTLRTSPTPVESWNGNSGRSSHSDRGNSDRGSTDEVVGKTDEPNGQYDDPKANTRGAKTVRRVDTRCTADDLREKCRQLQHEICMLSYFKHPNILSFVACSISEKHIFLVTELMPLGSLYDFLRTSRRSRGYNIRDAYDFARDVAAACQHVHGLGIVHGDLKTANLLVTIVEPDGSSMMRSSTDVDAHDGDTNHSKSRNSRRNSRFGVKIADFGCAAWTKQKEQPLKHGVASKAWVQPSPPMRKHGTQTRPQFLREPVAATLGTLYNSPPEILASRSPNTMQSDAYAYGMVLWELLSCCCPYVSEGMPLQTISTLVVDHNRRPYLGPETRRRMRGLLRGKCNEVPNVASEATTATTAPMTTSTTSTMPMISATAAATAVTATATTAPTPGGVYLETMRKCLEPDPHRRPPFDAICQNMSRFSELVLHKDALIASNYDSDSNGFIGMTQADSHRRKKARQSDALMIDKIWRDLFCPRPHERNYVNLADLASATLFPATLVSWSPRGRRSEYRYGAGRRRKDKDEDCSRAFVSDLRDNLPYGAGRDGGDRCVDKWLFMSACWSLTTPGREKMLKRWKSYLLLKRDGHHSRHYRIRSPVSGRGSIVEEFAGG